MTKHRVVIVGSGFGGLFAAQQLAHADVDVVLIANTTHHLFQPLLYQVATGILSAGSIAPTTREILKHQKNAHVLMGTVEDIDPEKQIVYWRNYGQRRATTYDSLIVAAGVGQSYFGNDQFTTFAPGMKTIDDALELRSRIFGAFEQAEVSEDPDRIAELMTFVIVGAGPTGVEMAGQIRELSSKTLKGEFRNIDPTKARVILVEGGPQPLPTFGTELGERTLEALTKLGVEFRGNTFVTDLNAETVTMRDKDGNEEIIPATCKVWAAGVQGPPIAKVVAERTGAELDRAGRVRVAENLTVAAYDNFYVIGDMMSLDGVPGVAQGAIQSAKFATKQIKDKLAGVMPEEKFVYNDKGSMATIAKSKAVASIGDLQLDGLPAWLAWGVLHVFYITGFKSRVSTLFHWAISFASNARSERTTTNQMMVGRLALTKLGVGGSTKLVHGESPEEIYQRASSEMMREYTRGVDIAEQDIKE